MYWFAGSRATIVHNFLYTIPIFWLTVFQAPPLLYLLAGCHSALTNHWMHANVRLETRRIEWLIITPRTHHIHHSDALEHRDKNFGSLFSVWDRLFGTYVDPETVQAEKLSFGIGEDRHPVRLFLGL
jgi:sterol desaturase/sphingolipid hydroxylase (fatty acid hydroxylase superfamily)